MDVPDRRPQPEPLLLSQHQRKKRQHPAPGGKFTEMRTWSARERGGRSAQQGFCFRFAGRVDTYGDIGSRHTIPTNTPVWRNSVTHCVRQQTLALDTGISKEMF